jgi:hypothetical protein
MSVDFTSRLKNIIQRVHCLDPLAPRVCACSKNDQANLPSQSQSCVAVILSTSMPSSELLLAHTRRPNRRKSVSSRLKIGAGLQVARQFLIGTESRFRNSCSDPGTANGCEAPPLESFCGIRSRISRGDFLIFCPRRVFVCLFTAS